MPLFCVDVLSSASFLLCCYLFFFSQVEFYGTEYLKNEQLRGKKFYVIQLSIFFAINSQFLMHERRNFYCDTLRNIFRGALDTFSFSSKRAVVRVTLIVSSSSNNFLDSPTFFVLSIKKASSSQMR